MTASTRRASSSTATARGRSGTGPRAVPSACSPTIETRTTRAGAGWSRPEPRCLDVARVRRRTGTRRGGPDRRVHRRARAPDRRRPRRVRGDPRARPLHRRDRGASVQAAAGMTLHLIPSNGAGVGHARRTGMDLAAERLPPDGLIATTDADSTPAPDWLATQLTPSPQGAQGDRRPDRRAATPPALRAGPARGGRDATAGGAARRRRARAPPVLRRVVRGHFQRRTRVSGGWSPATLWRMRASSARSGTTGSRSSGSPR